MNTPRVLSLVALLAAAQARPSQRNEVILAMSQFRISFSKEGKKIYTPGAGKVWILHPDENWRREEIPHRHSKAVHKATVFDIDFDGKNELVVVGGTDATILSYKHVRGQWQERAIWHLGRLSSRAGGQGDSPQRTVPGAAEHVRVRDIEFGDVDGDGEVEFVVATHDRGVVAVFDYIEGAWRGKEVYRTEDPRYVHEIEMGDVDGDGIKEFFANPSQPNVDVGIAQPGKVIMFKWDGRQYRSNIVDDFASTHAKEILVADLYGDRRPRLIVPVEGRGRKLGPDSVELLRPTELREHAWQADGRRMVRVIGTIDDIQCRSLAVGDVDNDGEVEIVAGCKLAGLFLFDRVGPRRWRRTLIDANSTAAVHALCIADFDGDGKAELLSASDDTDSLDSYAWRDGKWEKHTIAKLPPHDWVWTIEWGDADNR